MIFLVLGSYSRRLWTAVMIHRIAWFEGIVLEDVEFANSLG